MISAFRVQSAETDCVISIEFRVTQSRQKMESPGRAKLDGFEVKLKNSNYRKIA